MITQVIIGELRNMIGYLGHYKDFFHGSAYADALNQGLIKDDDIVMMFLLDSAQLYKNKQSDCWIAIFVVFDLAPDMWYKKVAVLPAFVIPGPNKPKVMDSFLFNTFSHISALQKKGFCMWDVSKGHIVTSTPFLAMGTADGLGLIYLNGLVGHMGKNGCHLYCGVHGHRKPWEPHYYLALLKPFEYTVEGCDHEDIDYESVSIITPSTNIYKENLTKLMSSWTDIKYKANRLATGIVKPNIMHQASINMPDLLLPLWHGMIDSGPNDRASLWPWAVLKGDIWILHGLAVTAATQFLPGSFDQPPQNPALKINSGYKAWEFLLYLYGLGPAVFYGVLPSPNYENFCDLVFAMRIVNQHHISQEQLMQAAGAFKSFVK
ncbi:hypothetical protein DXG01_002594, partial [Tephrocybe rancida]